MNRVTEKVRSYFDQFVLEAIERANIEMSVDKAIEDAQINTLAEEAIERMRINLQVEINQLSIDFVNDAISDADIDVLVEDEVNRRIGIMLNKLRIKLPSGEILIPYVEEV